MTWLPVDPAAADLLASGLKPVLLEAGPGVDTFARTRGHVRMSCPWRYNIDKAGSARLAASGWQAPDDEAFPTGSKLVDAYLWPPAKMPEIASRCAAAQGAACCAPAGEPVPGTAGERAPPSK